VAIEGIGGSFARNNLIGQSGTLFALSFSVYWVIMGLGRLEIHEHGIWIYWGLVKWSRIKGYSWAEDVFDRYDHYTLYVYHAVGGFALLTIYKIIKGMPGKPGKNDDIEHGDPADP
jgi:hypothetical protein